MLVDPRMVSVEVDYRREKLSKSFPKRAPKAEAENSPVFWTRMMTLKARGV